MSETCQICESKYHTVYRVSDDVWAKVFGRDDGSGLLCPACVDERARGLGIVLYWEAAVDRFPVEEAPRLREIAEGLRALDWCIGYELTRLNHVELDRIRGIAFEIAEAEADKPPPEPCPECKGDGYILDVRPGVGVDVRRVDCSACKGTGHGPDMTDERQTDE